MAQAATSCRWLEEERVGEMTFQSGCEYLYHCALPKRMLAGDWAALPQPAISAITGHQRWRTSCLSPIRGAYQGMRSSPGRRKPVIPWPAARPVASRYIRTLGGENSLLAGVSVGMQRDKHIITQRSVSASEAAAWPNVPRCNEPPAAGARQRSDRESLWVHRALAVTSYLGSRHSLDLAIAVRACPHVDTILS